VDSLNIYPSHGGVISGRERILTIYSDLRRDFNVANTQLNPGDDKIALREIDKLYKQFYITHQARLSHYLRNLSALLEFVANSSIENPKLYSNVVRAQLSTGEISILFYTGLSDLGDNKFKPLIERYSLLEGLDIETIADREHLYLYEPQAYGQRPKWLSAT